jgi:hypothetical protein
MAPGDDTNGKYALFEAVCSDSSSPWLDKAVARLEAGQPLLEGFPQLAPLILPAVCRQVPSRQGGGCVFPGPEADPGESNRWTDG